MIFTSKALAVGAMVIGIASSADAATWTLSALSKDSVDAFTCRIANGNTKPLSVTMDLMDSNGTLLATSGALTVAPGETSSVSYDGPTTIAYCVVSGGMTKSKTPATFCARPSGSGRCDGTVTYP